MKVAILIGSIRNGRQSHKIGHYLETRLKQRGILADLIDPVQKPACPSAGGHVCRAAFAENISDISTRLHDADALVFITPEYHGSYSGILKFILDRVWTKFYRKTIGVVTVSTGKMGGINASTQLQHVILSLGAYAVPIKLLVPDVENAFDENFHPVHEKMVMAADKFLDEFLWLAGAVAKKKKTIPIL